MFVLLLGLLLGLLVFDRERRRERRGEASRDWKVVRDWLEGWRGGGRASGGRAVVKERS